MKIETLIKTNTNEVIEYYNECWLNRFQNGHNPISLAMHMGYFDENGVDNDTAKLNANKYLSQYVSIPANHPVAIADLGCGVGGTCLYLATQFPLSKITGINISAEQLEFAKEIRNKKHKQSQIDYKIADYSNTGLSGSYFDFVIGIESICHAADKVRVYEEAFRLLSPSGTFVFMDYFEASEPQNEEQQELLNDFRKGWAVESYIKGYEGDLAQAGFERIFSESIIEKVKPGIFQSSQKARHRLTVLQPDSSSLFYHHLKACIALNDLIEVGVIDYKIVRAIK